MKGQNYAQTTDPYWNYMFLWLPIPMHSCYPQVDIQLLTDSLNP